MSIKEGIIIKTDLYRQLAGTDLKSKLQKVIFSQIADNEETISFERNSPLLFQHL